MKGWILAALAALMVAGPTTVLAASADAPSDTFPGIEHITSKESVNEAEAFLRQALKSRGMTLFTVVDHTQGATEAGLELPPTRTFIFGNPKVGTPLMQCRGSAALDLPQKMVIRKDGDITRIEWNDPMYLAKRHGLEACDLPLKKIAGVLSDLAHETAGEK